MIRMMGVIQPKYQGDFELQCIIFSQHYFSVKTSNFKNWIIFQTIIICQIPQIYLFYNWNTVLSLIPVPNTVSALLEPWGSINFLDFGKPSHPKRWFCRLKPERWECQTKAGQTISADCWAQSAVTHYRLYAVYYYCRVEFSDMKIMARSGPPSSVIKTIETYLYLTKTPPCLMEVCCVHSFWTSISILW